MSTIYIVGTGPGKKEYMTESAIQAIRQSDVVMGYKTYIRLIEALLDGKEVLSSGMRKEVDRCAQALEIALTGNTVSMISSGDPGVYGMAGVLFELAKKSGSDVEIEVVPGITSALSSASLLGAPLMNDFAVVSLSDLMTPWPMIEKRIEAAAMGDFVISIYNPRSNERVHQIEIARDIILRFRDGQTPVGIVRNAMREKSTVIVTTLADMLNFDIDMVTTVIVGNSQTYAWNGKMITPRGYTL
jgi:precorrin-3B C17-methyltransferase